MTLPYNNKNKRKENVVKVVGTGYLVVAAIIVVVVAELLVTMKKMLQMVGVLINQKDHGLHHPYFP